MPFDPEQGRNSDVTMFELPLFSPLSMENGFTKFANLTLANGLHNNTSELTEAVVLATDAAHAFFRAVHKEAKMLDDKEKYQLLVQAHELRVKECDEKMKELESLHVELMQKADNFNTLESVYEQCALDLESEHYFRQLCLDMCQSEWLKITLLKARKARVERESVAREKALRTEVRMLQEQIFEERELSAYLRAEKERAVEDFKASPKFKVKEVLWKREAYNEGLEMNFNIFNYWGV